MIWVYLGVGLILTRVPYVGKYFRIFNTLVHEIGHFLMSLIVGARVYKVSLNADTSGEAVTESRGRIRNILIAFAGYPFASGVALLSVWVLEKGYYEYFLYGVTTIAVVSMLLWVRNKFGIAWLSLVTVVSVLLANYGSVEIISVYVWIIVGVMLMESVSSTVQLVVLAKRDKYSAGDATNLSQFTYIPAMVWAIVFMAIACYVLLLAVKII